MVRSVDDMTISLMRQQFKAAQPAKREEEKKPSQERNISKRAKPAHVTPSGKVTFARRNG